MADLGPAQLPSLCPARSAPHAPRADRAQPRVRRAGRSVRRSDWTPFF